MRRPLSRRNTPEGLSLLELVVAVMVLSIGILAAFRAVDQATLQIGGEAPRVLAAEVARNRAEELALLGAEAGRALPRSVGMGPFEWQVAVEEAATEGGLVEATIRVTSPEHPGAVLVAFVPVDPAE